MTLQTDHAISDVSEDRLDRANLAETLFDVLQGPDLQTPITVGIYGGWGSGKTSVMNMVRRRLETEKAGITLWFNAWKYASSDETLWRALLLEIVTALGDAETGIPAMPAKTHPGPSAQAGPEQPLEDRLKALRDSLYRSRSWTEQGALTVNWKHAVPFAFDLALRASGLSSTFGFLSLFRSRKTAADKLDAERKQITDDASATMELFERAQIERFQAHVKSLEQFEDALKKLIQDEIATRNLRLYVFIDDLDRCMPDEAVSALEAIKLFMDQKDCVFILGMDRDAVEQGIRHRYPVLRDETGQSKVQVDPRKYLDKIIQLPFNLAPLSAGQVRGFVENLLAPTGADPQLTDRIVAACPPNPRTLKRVLNVLTLQRRLLPYLDPEQFGLLSKLVLIQTLYDRVFEMISGNVEELLEFEAAINQLDGLGMLSLSPEDRERDHPGMYVHEGRLWDEAFELGADEKLIALFTDEPKFASSPFSLEQLLNQTQATSDRSYESADAQRKEKRVRRKK